jgi:hypothetical protein
LVFLPLFYFGLDFYNSHIDLIRNWAERAQAEGEHPALASAVLSHLHRMPIPDLSLVIWIAAVFLALGATVFAAAAPSRVREFSRDQWCDELNKPLIHYWPYAWRYRWARVACVLFYGTGGLCAAIVLVIKLWDVLAFILRNSSFRAGY